MKTFLFCLFFIVFGNSFINAQLVRDNYEYQSLLHDRGIFKIKNIDANTSAREYPTSFYGKKQNRLVFVSRRKQDLFIKKIFSSKQSFPELLYIADVKRGNVSNIKLFKKRFYKNYTEISVSFSDKDSFVAYTLSPVYKDKKRKNEEELNYKIVFSDSRNGEKQKLSSFKYNDKEYFVTYPALTEDGKTMYFVSDMPGGYGGTDIYVTRLGDDNQWSEPVNLGKSINTEGNEMFPFIHKNGVLFFASDGLSGLGGLDIFMTKQTKGKWSEPQNLGVPVNSSNDDFAFIINNKMKSGFFSSNRENGKGEDDIYSFKLLKPLLFDISVKGTVKDNYGNVLANTNVSLFDQEGNLLKIVNTDNNGSYEFKVHQNELYSLEAEKPKYQDDKRDIDTKGKSFVSLNLVLEKLPDFTVSGLVVDKETKNKLSDVKILSINNKTGKKELLTSSEYGVFLIKLPENNLYDSIDYTFKAEKKGYASKTVSYKQVLKKFGEYNTEIQLNKISVGEDLGKIIEIKPIYFDFDKYDIRPDAAAELDKIVEVMNAYPTMEIELSSHTDCRGSAIYNLKLSDKRAKASADYIKKRISEPTRINGRGFGETQLVNNCSCEGGKGNTCTEEQHQENRRTEFKIIRK